MIEGDRVVDAEVTPEEQTRLTTDYTTRAVDFIRRNKDRPFFLYVPHSMPHVPLFVSDKFKGKSEQGLYGDVIMEIDWSVGQITEELRKQGLAENTLVIFTSDNGGAGYIGLPDVNRPFRGWKITLFEGGIHVPFFAKWPARIPAGSVVSAPVPVTV